MKKLLIATAAMAGFAGVAHAQSSVTLYGTLDTAIGYTSNVIGTGTYGKTAVTSGKLLGMQSGNLTGNQWGMRGNEDLGNGLAAIFNLQSGFDIDSGKSAQGGTLFGRQAYVGLQSKQFGTVTLGRQYDSSIDLVQPVTNDDTFGSIFATPGDIDNYDNSYRTNNTIKYTSPNVQGLQVSASYGFGNNAGATGSGQTIAVAGAYGNGPVNVAASYFRATAGNSTSFGGLGTGTCSVGGCDSQAISGVYSTAKSLQVIRAGGSFATGPVTLGAAYSNVQYKNYAGLSNRTSFNTGQAYANFQATPALLLGIGYDYTKGSGNGVNVAYQQISAGADYSLSKRTDLYVVGGFQHSKGNTYQFNNTGGISLDAAPASMADFGNDSDKRGQGVALVGVRHSF